MRTSYRCVASLRAAIVLYVAFLLIPVSAAIRGPGKYNGVVIFDRWDACHLYSGVYMMEVSEKIKETLRHFDGKAVLIDAQEVLQPINPGDGLITKLAVLGPAVEPGEVSLNKPPKLDGLRLRAIPAFRMQGSDELVIEVQNEGTVRQEIDVTALAPTILAKRQGLGCVFSPADGPAYAAITRSDVASLSQGLWGSACTANGKDVVARLSLVPGAVFARQTGLDPSQSIEVPLRFELSPGEYEFLAGYGGGVHAARALVSNRGRFSGSEQ
jgi:hypothetical protein